MDHYVFIIISSINILILPCFITASALSLWVVNPGMIWVGSNWLTKFVLMLGCGLGLAICLVGSIKKWRVSRRLDMFCLILGYIFTHFWLYDLFMFDCGCGVCEGQKHLRSDSGSIHFQWVRDCPGNCITIWTSGVGFLHSPSFR